MKTRAPNLAMLEMDSWMGQLQDKVDQTFSHVSGKMRSTQHSYKSGSELNLLILGEIFAHWKITVKNQLREVLNHAVDEDLALQIHPRNLFQDSI